VRRIYGDFSSARSKSWADILSKHAIIPQQQFAYTTGKNVSDITLVIDAMDLPHSGRFTAMTAPLSNVRMVPSRGNRPGSGAGRYLETRALSCPNITLCRVIPRRMHALNIGAQCPGHIELMLPGRPGELCSMPRFPEPPSKLSDRAATQTPFHQRAMTRNNCTRHPLRNVPTKRGSLATAFQ
jgi:hypothetical protein